MEKDIGITGNQRKIDYWPTFKEISEVQSGSFDYRKVDNAHKKQTFIKNDTPGKQFPVSKAETRSVKTAQDDQTQTSMADIKIVEDNIEYLFNSEDDPKETEKLLKYTFSKINPIIAKLYDRFLKEKLSPKLIEHVIDVEKLVYPLIAISEKHNDFNQYTRGMLCLGKILLMQDKSKKIIEYIKESEYIKTKFKQVQAVISLDTKEELTIIRSFKRLRNIAVIAQNPQDRLNLINNINTHIAQAFHTNETTIAILDIATVKYLRLQSKIDAFMDLMNAIRNNKETNTPYINRVIDQETMILFILQRKPEDAHIIFNKMDESNSTFEMFFHEVLLSLDKLVYNVIYHSPVDQNKLHYIINLLLYYIENMEEYDLEVKRILISRLLETLLQGIITTPDLEKKEQMIELFDIINRLASKTIPGVRYYPTTKDLFTELANMKMYQAKMMTNLIYFKRKLGKARVIRNDLHLLFYKINPNIDHIPL